MTKQNPRHQELRTVTGDSPSGRVKRRIVIWEENDETTCLWILPIDKNPETYKGGWQINLEKTELEELRDKISEILDD